MVLRNADADDKCVLRELSQTSISKVLQMTFIDALDLNRDAWAADGVIQFDRRVVVQLAVDEAERAEAAAEWLIPSRQSNAMHQRSTNESTGNRTIDIAPV